MRSPPPPVAPSAPPPRGSQETPPTATRSAHAPTRLTIGCRRRRLLPRPDAAIPGASKPGRPVSPSSTRRPHPGPERATPQPTGGRRRRRLTGPLIAAVRCRGSRRWYDWLSVTSPFTRNQIHRPRHRVRRRSRSPPRLRADVCRSLASMVPMASRWTARRCFVTDSGNNRVLELSAGLAVPPNCNSPGWASQRGHGGRRPHRVRHELANGRVLKLAAGSTSTIELPDQPQRAPRRGGRYRRRPLPSRREPVLRLPAGFEQHRRFAFQRPQWPQPVWPWTAPATSMSPTPATTGC